MSGGSPGGKRQSLHMSERGICGKPTVKGPPCKNPPGCTLQHPSPAASRARSAARDKATQTATAQALADQADELTVDDSSVGLAVPGSGRSTVSVPNVVWEEWEKADRKLWVMRGADYDPAAHALETIERSEPVIRRLAAEQADWLNERGLPGDIAEADAERWANASLELRDAAFGPRPSSTATITKDYGNWPRSDPDDNGTRDPKWANCEMKSEDGRTTLDIEGLHEGTVMLNMRHVPEHLGWGHTEPEVAWDLTEDEARTLVAELTHRFGWDEH